jgi:hypothetical protein
MTAPFAGIKRVLHLPEDYILDDGEPFGAKALRKIYRNVLNERSRERYLQRNKTKIAELLPIWFDHDALMGNFDATERMECRRIGRKARQGVISAKEASDELSAVRKRLNEHREGARHDFAKALNRAMRNAGVQNLEFNYGDACRLFGEGVWAQMLDRSCHSVKYWGKEDKRIELFVDFCELYNITIPEFCDDAAILTIGFDDIVLAAIMKQKQKVVAVAAIDDVRGRKALRVLVGNKQLVEILPKRVYNAITRQESFYVRGTLCYYPPKHTPTIVIF